MTNLRQGRWLGPGFPGRSSFTFAAAALVCAGLSLPGAFASAPHTHARRPLPTALHPARLAEAGSGPAGKHGKGAAKSKAGTRSAGATTGEAARKKGGKRGKAHPQLEDTEDPPIPLYRARHGASPGGRNSAQTARVEHGGRHPKGSFYGPAPLVSHDRRSARGHVELAAIHPAKAAESLHAVHTAAVDPQRWAASRPETRRTAVVSPAKPAPMVTPAPADVYAQGVSHPDDDERLPRDRTVLGEDAPATSPAPVVRASAAPSAVAPGQLPAPAVVQGFGGEIAVPSPAPSNRPGGTRRRGHPSNWQPESVATPPEPLEEREAITYAAVSPAVLPEIYDHNGRLMMPAPLKGSHDVLVHQNVMADSDGLDRIYDDADLERMRANHLLVSFPLSESLRVNEDLPLNRRVARPWTVMFAADIGHAFYARFHQPLQVNSAVRTVRYQARLQMVNGNAAAISGDAASPHLTGQAIDFGKRGLSQAEMAWMRGYLLPLMQAGKIDVEEEFQQACFHISVYRSYVAGRRSSRELAQVHAATAEDATNEAVAKPRLIAP